MSDITPDTTPVTPAAPEVAKPATPPAEEMKTYKVNGKEYQVPVSKIDERVQKSFGAEEAMQKAASLEKAFNSFVSQAQNPEQLLGLLNHPSMKYDEEKQEMLVKSMLNSKKPRIINAVKEWIYKNEIEPKTMDPKELELRELKAYKEQQEKLRETQESERKEAEKQQAVQKAWNDYRTKIGTEIKTQGLPQTEATVARVARYALLYTKAGKPVDLTDCAARVKADLLAESNERYSSATDDNILDLLPEGMAERINKALMKRLKGGAEVTGKPDVEAPAAKSDPEATRKMLRDLERGKKVF
jgi:type I site-specific restriction endonuclease